MGDGVDHGRKAWQRGCGAAGHITSEGRVMSAAAQSFSAFSCCIQSRLSALGTVLLTFIGGSSLLSSTSGNTLTNTLRGVSPRRLQIQSLQPGRLNMIRSICRGGQSSSLGEAPLPSESRCLGQSWPSWNSKVIGGARGGKETIWWDKFFSSFMIRQVGQCQDVSCPH